MSEKIVDSDQQPVERKKPEDYFFRASAADFKKIPGSPIAYWASDKVLDIFQNSAPLEQTARPRQGMATTNNDLFLRRWHEVSQKNVNYTAKSEVNAEVSGKKWFPYNKGGGYRKWFGNNEFLVNYENKGQAICDYIDNTVGAKVGSNGRVINREMYFKPSITWSFISSSYFGVRYSQEGFVFDVAGSSVFPKISEIHWLTGFLCSKLSTLFLRIMNPTLNFQVGNVAALPLMMASDQSGIDDVVKKVVLISKNDWNSYETSWGFQNFLLLHSDCRQQKIHDGYQEVLHHWKVMMKRMKCLEEENNYIFIEAYGLQGELTPDVPLKEITLTCNPHYRYGGGCSEVELESLLLADTMKELISYAVGCMFGRYSLDKEGLILANQGETLDDYISQVPEPSFMPDDDNVIPVLDGEWFTDDITERFRRFLRTTFGEEHYQENLAFIEQSIGKDIRKYFLKDFYADHVKRYKKRPIYWMFSSPKGSFNALIYMHRYQPTTASVVLNGYLREFRTKLIARKEHLEQVSISASVSQRDKTQALKEIEKLKKMIDELESWEREVLYPLAAEQIDIDLDDGVKLNYPKFGKALKKVVGLS